MPKYKVGDVAALFPKPSAPKSDTGMKIQSMFDDFYKNSKKLHKPNMAQFGQIKKQTNNKESESPREDKKKKRKYTDMDHTESNAQNTIQHQNKQKKSKLDPTHLKSNGKTAQEDNYFPRNKKKSKHFNSDKESSSAVSTMHFDDDQEENRLNSEEQKVSGKMKKKNKLSKTKIVENNDLEKVKNKPKKMKTFINSKNQSEEFNLTDTSTFKETIKEKLSPEKKLNKKKKKKKQNKNVQNESVEHEVHLATGDSDVQSDNAEPKVKQKSKKMKVSIFSKEGLNKISETDHSLEEKDESLKSSLIKKKSKKKQQETDERLSRTLFVGNLPVRVTRHELHKLFAPFGSIEACRLRGSVPVKATVPKKIAAIKSEFHAGQKSCIGYVVFKEEKDATEALALNGYLFHNHHIVVNPASSTNEKKMYDEKRSIFIGNLPFDVENEAIWSAFAACGEVEAVRAIRDPETGAGKGFGYVLFKNIGSKEKALKMEGIEIANRKIRIKEVKSDLRKQVPSSNNRLNALRRKAKNLKSNQNGPNSRKSLKKLMNREKRNYQKKKIASIFKKFST